MHGKFKLFFSGERDSHNTALPSFLFFSCVQCFCVFIPPAPAVSPALLQQMDKGSLKRTHLGVCRTHKHTHTDNASAQHFWLGGDGRGGLSWFFLVLLMGVQSNLGSLDLESDAPIPIDLPCHPHSDALTTPVYNILLFLYLVRKGKVVDTNISSRLE